MTAKNRSVLITGSSRGLGRELALVFASNGYEIVLHGRDKDRLAELKEHVLGKGVKCFVSVGDLRSAKTVADLFEIARKRHLSVLINNAAVQCPRLPLERISDEEIDRLLTTNLVVPVKLTRKIYSLFLKWKSGTIININSVSGLENQEQRSAYCASKWGLRGFTDTIRLEAKKHNIRVIGVYPSRIKTSPGYSRGMKAPDVAERIFHVYENTRKNEIRLDGRSNR